MDNTSALAGLLTVSPTTFVPEDTVVWMGGQPAVWDGGLCSEESD